MDAHTNVCGLMLLFCQIRLTMKIMSKWNCWLSGVQRKRTCCQSLVSQLTKSRTCWISTVYDARIAKVVLSQEESAEYAKLYHPYKWADFTALTQLPMDDVLQAMTGKTPDMIVVPEERFWAASDQFFSEEAWPLLQATLIVGIANAFTSYLSDEIRVLGGAYGRALSGTPEALNKQKAAYYLAAGPYTQALGLWYAGEKFSEAAKQDVEQKVATMIDVYKQRLQSADWLQQATRDKAVVKLDAFMPHIGYPEKLPDRYKDKIVDDGADLFETAEKFRAQAVAHQWSSGINRLTVRSGTCQPTHGERLLRSTTKPNCVPSGDFASAILQLGPIFIS